MSDDVYAVCEDCRAVIMLCDEGFEHLDLWGRPCGKIRVKVSREPGGHTEHEARPLRDSNGQVVATDAEGRPLPRRKGEER